MPKAILNIVPNSFEELLYLIIVIIIGICLIVGIVQHGKTKRAKVLVDATTDEKKKEIAAKQLENEIVDNNKDKKNNVIDYADAVAKFLK